MLVVVGLVFFVAFYPSLLTKKQSTELDTAAVAVKTEIAERIGAIGANTNSEMSVESADTYIEEIDQLLTKAVNKEQVFELKRLQMKTYSNTNRAELGVAIGEQLLETGGLSEEQKLNIYVFMADSHLRQIRNPDQLEKWVELMQESVDLLEVPAYDVNVVYYRVRLGEQRAGIYAAD
jgi:hypothetical protein